MSDASDPPSSDLLPRVLIVSEPGADGVFRHVEALIEYLIGEGIEVDLAYSDVRNCPELYALVWLVEAHGGKTLNLQTGNRPTPRDIKALAALWRLARVRRPSIIHAHSSKAGALVRLMRLFGVQCPTFYTPHAYYGMGSDSKAARFFNAIEAILARVGKTINLSKTEADYAREKFALPIEKQSIRHNGIDCVRFRPPAPDERARIRQTLSIPKGAMVLGTAARYSPQKDPVTLHAAIRELLPRHENLWFVHIGKGELWESVNALGPSQPRIIRIPSFRPMPDFYRALDGFVLASRYEGFSLSVLEALATGLPVILSRVPGNRDFEAFGLNTVYWTEPFNVRDLVDTIEDWIVSDHAPTNHRDIALTYFQQDACFKWLVEEYRRSLPPARQAKGFHASSAR